MLDRNTGRGSPGAFRKHIERSHWQQLELELAEVECLFGLRWLAMRALEINLICRPHVAQLGEKKNQLCRQTVGLDLGVSPFQERLPLKSPRPVADGASQPPRRDNSFIQGFCTFILYLEEPNIRDDQSVIWWIF